METKIAIQCFGDDNQEIFKVHDKILTPKEFVKLQALMQVQWLIVHVVEPAQYPEWHPGFKIKN